MKQDTHKTTVRFYIESDGSILAYFPKESYFPQIDGGITKTCYARVGQHSACHPDYIRKMKKATPDQYQSLKEELESEGYNLLIK